MHLAIYGFSRRIDVQHLFDGQLGVALYNEGVTRATAHFAVTLVNHNNEKNIVGGDASSDGSQLRTLCS